MARAVVTILAVIMALALGFSLGPWLLDRTIRNVPGQDLTGMAWYQELDPNAIPSECGDMRGSVPWAISECVLTRKTPAAVVRSVNSVLLRDKTLRSDSQWMLAGACEGIILVRRDTPFLLTVCPVYNRGWAKVSIASI